MDFSAWGKTNRLSQRPSRHLLLSDKNRYGEIVSPSDGNAWTSGLMTQTTSHLLKQSRIPSIFNSFRRPLLINQNARVDISKRPLSQSRPEQAFQRMTVAGGRPSSFYLSGVVEVSHGSRSGPRKLSVGLKESLWRQGRRCGDGDISLGGLSYGPAGQGVQTVPALRWAVITTPPGQPRTTEVLINL